MFKTLTLLAILTAFFMGIGYLIGGYTGIIIAFIFAALMNGFAYWGSDKMVLSMSGAKEATKSDYPEYHTLVEKLADKANLPMPKLYVINKDESNAFATGRNQNNSSVAVTTGILNILNNKELEGVLAHELAHIKHKDILISTITATFAGAISMIGNMLMFNMIFGGFRNNNDNNGGGALSMIVSLLIMIVGPIVAMIIQMAISRDREYKADNYGGKLCGNPLMLASALLKLEQVHHNNMQKYNDNLGNVENAKKDKALAHMYIVNPFLNEGDSLFSTHPATSNRVNALVSLAKTMNININNWQKEITLEKNNNINGSLNNLKVEEKKEKPIDYDTPNNPWI